MEQSGGKDSGSVRPWWLKGLSVLGTVNVVVIVTFFGLAFAVIPAEGLEPGWELTWHYLGTIACLGRGVVLIWRMRFPRMVMAVSGIGSLVLPLDPIAPAVALSWVLARSQARNFIWAVPLAAAGIAVPLWRDCVAEASQALFTTPKDQGPVVHLDPLSYVLVGLTMFLVAVAAGLVRLWSGRVRAARAETKAQEATVKVLREQLDRQEERDLIAREMHDTVAHQLSLVSLRAAAFEATASDPATSEFSRAVRSSAHQGLEEMRSLIHSLRDSSDGGYFGETPDLNDLQALIKTAQESGMVINATILLPGEALPSAVARGTYRIIQEALTNALRHAPGQVVSLEVSGAKGKGISIVIANPYSSVAQADASQSDSGAGAGSGLLGMSERAVALGGTLSVTTEGKLWTIRGWLPWEGA